MIKPIKIAIPPKLGTEEVWDVLLFGTATNDFVLAISTMEGIRKNVIPAANPKQSRIFRSITEKLSIRLILYVQI